MIYTSLKLIVRLYLPLFFKEIHVQGRNKIPNNQPVIFAVNHQNTFMDATLVAMLTNRKVFFLVRSDVFKGKLIKWILHLLHLIPIYRAQDKTPNLAKSNKKTFATCIDHLKNNQSILIFPEGKSKARHGLSKLKKGVARLGLQAEKEHDFQLGLQVIPVSINYQFHFKGNSNVWIKYCDPIKVSEYQSNYEKSKGKATTGFTKDLKNSLSDNLLIFPKKEGDNESFFQKVIQRNITSTDDLISFHKSFLDQEKKAFDMPFNFFNRLLSLFAKGIFFPAIIFTFLLNKVINDKDFYLSIICFSLLIFCTLQLGFTFVVVWWYGGIIWALASVLFLFFSFIALIKTFFQ